MASINTHSYMMDEILEKINSAPDVVESLKEFYKQPYFKKYMEYAVADQWITLDIGGVVFKQYDYHRSMCGALLLNRQTMNITDNIFFKESVPDRTKAVQFKALSEMLYVGEQKILHAIMYKNIDSLYPNITFDKIIKSLEV